jgi:hypothetical protein
MDLPTGTITFLFTDLEGSTRLWERDAEAMRAALARHDALLRRAFESQGGHVFKTGPYSPLICPSTSAPSRPGGQRWARGTSSRPGTREWRWRSRTRSRSRWATSETRPALPGWSFPTRPELREASPSRVPCRGVFAL